MPFHTGCNLSTHSLQKKTVSLFVRNLSTQKKSLRHPPIIRTMSFQPPPPPPSSRSFPHSLPFLVRFYDPTIHAPDAHNRTLPTILSWPDSALESRHDYIQILFPLPEPSPVHPSAPTIDEATFTHFRSTPSLRAELRRALERMIAFYGLESSSSAGYSPSSSTTTSTTYSVHLSPLFPLRAPLTWLTRNNHNHLRITRIIRSLRVLGCAVEAEAFYTALKDVADGRGGISARSMGFWTRAARGALNVPPEDERGDIGQGEGWLRGG